MVWGRRLGLTSQSLLSLNSPFSHDRLYIERYIYPRLQNRDMPSIFDPFLQIHPGRFIQQFSDWIIFTLLLVFFISIAGITLHRRFPDSRYGRPLIISVGLMLAVGVYYSIYKGWLHLSLQGFGLVGAALVILVIFFVVYGMIRGFGMHTSTAIPLDMPCSISHFGQSPQISSIHLPTEYRSSTVSS